ncbi:anhydro-N-acetylmuramic acid kinase [Usitatibacter palustris]|uniref:Anhydro-N-acetylmuramic acid kinase n=1 Tax=Usitatibacter palustris TaxID=2732487 RepID=A0A6M4H2H8_9PROT|nr:anhydro-N-acetylmuramic acid kinase [Usitatibacter palustris]QJR13706.1 Anhydro-N-acetylmuramic acid kinase [Usitatibacter palustris]
MTPLYAGVMSGTSLDGADAAIVDFEHSPPRTVAFATIDFAPDLRKRLLALNYAETDSLDASAEATIDLAEAYAAAVRETMARASLGRERIAAIGCHGQTVRHRPERGFTIQLNDPARLAELVGIDVVADFRRRDMAAGGQGAPLAPAFHDHVFRHATIARAIVNVGGISNVSLLVPGKPHTGFDCGPGNVLLDAWAQRHLGTPYDEDGKWAGGGKVEPRFLASLLADPFFDKPPPKSTGRELFNLEWLDAKVPKGTTAQDIQATLLEATARSIADAVARYGAVVGEVALCGGGARNPALLSRVRELCKPARVTTTDTLGIPSGHVEAAAFAWFAMKCLRREAIDLRGVTGANGPRILGAIYPA